MMAALLKQSWELELNWPKTGEWIMAWTAAKHLKNDFGGWMRVRRDSFLATTQRDPVKIVDDIGRDLYWLGLPFKDPSKCFDNISPRSLQPCSKVWMRRQAWAVEYADYSPAQHLVTLMTCQEESFSHFPPPLSSLIFNPSRKITPLSSRSKTIHEWLKGGGGLTFTSKIERVWWVPWHIAIN